jgi:hypothetical protein
VGVSWYVVAAWGAFALVFIGAWVTFAAGLARSMRALLRPRSVAAFANSRGWSYQRRGSSPLQPGPPYWSGVTADLCTQVVTGRFHDEEFVAFEYAHQAQVVTLALPVPLPFLEVQSRATPMRIAPTDPSVTLESEDFGRSFSVHADDPKLASDILTPRLMEQLMLAPPLCWRIFRDELVGWWPGEPLPERIPLYLDILHTVKDSIPRFVWRDHGLTNATTD